MNIKKLSELSNTPISTIRYYEKRGLVPVPHRSANNYRVYSQEDVYILDFIKSLIYFNFSLSEIKEIMQVALKKGYSTPFVEKMINKKLLEFQHKITIFSKLQKIFSKTLNNGVASNKDLRKAFEDLHNILQKYD